MGKIPTNSLGKSSELKLHCFCLYNAYSMPKDIYCAGSPYKMLEARQRLVKQANWKGGRKCSTLVSMKRATHL